jgi:hypothetical protein
VAAAQNQDQGQGLAVISDIKGTMMKKEIWEKHSGSSL